MDYKSEAAEFCRREKQFHLGFLPSEARNPLTYDLDSDFITDSRRGVQTLLSCDTALLSLVRDTLASDKFRRFAKAVRECLVRNGRIVISGCGAPGRIAILFERAWRRAFPGDERVISLMTGGDYALVRSVENFEDHAVTGAMQLRDLGFTSDDMLIGITATGETTSTVGSAMEAARTGAQVFMLICVDPAPAMERLERCRELYSHPNVTAISMPVGGMALTGSTRMQSSTVEMLVAGAALESAASGEIPDHNAYYEKMLQALTSPEAVAGIAGAVDLETAVYRDHGLIEYLAEDFLIDIISDTTERAPTFMIPPYHPAASDAPEPWAMVRHPYLATPEAWRHCLGRDFRCLDWSADRYRENGLEFLIARGIPAISAREMARILIGNEEIPARKGALRCEIRSTPEGVLLPGGNPVPAVVPQTPLRLFEHMRMKLCMNTLSTGTMAKLGRIRSNYMIHLDISNKKLIDRACRIISELCSVSYEEACCELFRTRHEGVPGESPVAATIRRLEGAGK